MRSTVLVLAAALVACSADPAPLPPPTPEPPIDPGPALEPLAEAPYLGTMVADSRRDGVFGRVEGGAVVVLSHAHEPSGAPRALFRVDSSEALATRVHLASRDDAQVAVSVPSRDGDRLFAWDGAARVELTARLRSAVITAHDPEHIFRVEAIDVSADGTLALGVTVGGQAFDAPYAQLCWLGAEDRCESADELLVDGPGSVEGIVETSTQTYVLADRSLHRRAHGASTWERVTLEPVDALIALDEERVAYAVPFAPPEWRAGLVVLDAAGAELRRVPGVDAAYGHSLDGLFVVSVGYTTTACSQGSTMCVPDVLGAYAQIQHVSETRRGIGAAQFAAPEGLRRWSVRWLPLGDGRIRLESPDAAFVAAR